MKRTLLSTILFFLLLEVTAQNIEWNRSKNWTIYDIHDGNAFHYSLDTLSNFKHFSLNDSVMQSFLSHSILWPKDSSSQWMGLYVTTCNLPDGVKHIIDISVYGGFLYEINSKRYYQVPSSEKDAWLKYILNVMINGTSNNKADH
jgi:hypothetical protein